MKQLQIIINTAYASLEYSLKLEKKGNKTH